MSRRPQLIPAAMASALALVAALSACASTTGRPQAEDCLSSGTASAAVDVSTEDSSATFAKPLTVSSAQSTTVQPGEGDRIGMQRLVSGTVRFYNANTGDEIATGQSDGAQTFRTVVASSAAGTDALSTALFTALTCARTGEVSVLAVPDVAISDAETAPVLAILHITDAISMRAEGRVIETRRGFPAVVRASTGQPGVSAPTVDAPEELKSQVVVEGKGDKIEAGEKLITACTAITYSTTDPQLISSTWDQSTVNALDTSSTDDLKALADTAFVGKRMGSQVVVIGPYVPGACENAMSGASGAPAAAMIYVFDLLGTV